MLTISTRGRYSLRILVLMASRPRGHMFAKHEIAEVEGVSCAYVQQLLSTLRTAGFVNSHRGKVGGFTLARDPETITVADVLGATEGQARLAPCLNAEGCERETICRTRPMWIRAEELFDEFFSGITVAELAGDEADARLKIALSS